MLENMLARGKTVLAHDQDPVDSHAEFNRWVREVRLWVESLCVEPELVTEWDRLSDSNLVRNGIHYTGESVWEDFEKGVLERLSWLTELYHRLPSEHLFAHDVGSDGNAPMRTPVWKLLHPTIANLCQGRFQAGHYADAVESAFKEINAIIKAKIGPLAQRGLDGAKLMNTVFSVNDPLLRLADTSSDSGHNIQQGYMQIFSGAMTGIRNPKAHANLQIDAERALHLLVLASLLMHKIDEAQPNSTS